MKKISVFIFAVVSVLLMWLIIFKIIPLPVWTAMIAPFLFVVYVDILMWLNLRNERKQYEKMLKKYEVLDKKENK